MSFSVRAVGGILPTGTAGSTNTVTLSDAVAPRLSVTVKRNTYVPCTRLYKPVVAELVLANVYPVGPLMRVHAYVAMVPSASLPLPYKVVVLTGKVIVISAPALAVGAWFVEALTLTVTRSVAVAPLLSVTVSLKTYVPCTRPFNPVAAEL